MVDVDKRQFRLGFGLGVRIRFGLRLDGARQLLHGRPGIQRACAATHLGPVVLLVDHGHGGLFQGGAHLLGRGVGIRGVQQRHGAAHDGGGHRCAACRGEAAAHVRGADVLARRADVFELVVVRPHEVGAVGFERGHRDALVEIRGVHLARVGRGGLVSVASGAYGEDVVRVERRLDHIVERLVVGLAVLIASEAHVDDAQVVELATVDQVEQVLVALHQIGARDLPLLVVHHFDGKQIGVVRGAGNAQRVVGDSRRDAGDHGAVARAVRDLARGERLLERCVPGEVGQDVVGKVFMVEIHAGVQHGDGDVVVALRLLPRVVQVGVVEPVLVVCRRRVGDLGVRVVDRRDRQRTHAGSGRARAARNVLLDDVDEVVHVVILDIGHALDIARLGEGLLVAQVACGIRGEHHLATLVLKRVADLKPCLTQLGDDLGFGKQVHVVAAQRAGLRGGRAVERDEDAVGCSGRVRGRRPGDDGGEAQPGHQGTREGACAPYATETLHRSSFLQGLVYCTAPVRTTRTPPTSICFFVRCVGAAYKSSCVWIQPDFCSRK